MHALSKTVATALVAGSSLSPAAAQLPPPEPAASAAPRSVRPDQPTARPPAADAPAPAAEQLRRVEVEGRASDESIRRAATASKIVITREEIDRFGDSTLGEVIKRLPGVTTGGRPGRGGDIRMRGMGGGYTQILVNGERMPPGFSLDQLPPDQVERIEVLRAPTAEFGARAIAGTINIVLREALQRRVNDLRLQLSEERGLLRPNLGWTRNDKFSPTGAYNLALNATRNARIDDINTSSTTHLLGTGEDSSIISRGRNESANESLNLSARLQWREPGGDSFALQPFVVVNRSSGHNTLDQTQGACSSDPASPVRCLNYDHADTDSHNRSAMGRLQAQWQHRLGEGTTLELRGAAGRMNAHGKSLREERLKGLPSRSQDDTTDSHFDMWSFNGKLSHPLGDEHSLVGGLEAEGQTLDQTRITLQNGQPLPALQDFGDNLSASTRRYAYYAQDEWSVGKRWSFYAGLRGETIRTASSNAGNPVSNRSSIWTPLLHAVWKLGDNSRDQLRASLTRSYRSPNLSDLIARPSINAQYACPDNGLCGPNVVNEPDRMGNPELKPEIARGLELGYENYLSLGGILSVNAFYRRIENLIRVEPQLETVPWAAVPRWVARPRNIGDATTYGLELEAKFRLDQFVSDAWPVNLRTNLSLFHSEVRQIPGPHNTLDQQPQGTLNLGFDYRLRSLPLTLGGNVNYTPGYEIQQTELQLTTLDKKRVADAFALWTFSPTLGVRLSAANLAPLDYFTGSVITTDKTVISTRSGGPSYTQWQLRLEMKL